MWYSFVFFCFVVCISGRTLNGIKEIHLNELPESPIVVIAQGTVIGSLSNDKQYAEFYGIPYADTTSGSNRFKAPNPAPSFKDTFDANRKDINCVRVLESGYEGTEDCLVVNVFTPTLDSTKQLSVIVWVKGNDIAKSSKRDREPSFSNIFEKNVVVVTLNYRESILGFLCLGTEAAPGNAGLKDIVAGLKWVTENIARFGGSPDDVTLVGYGTSAAAVDLVTVSPRGLVNKVILQNGNALSPWTVSCDNIEYAIQIAEALGHVSTDIEDLSEIFKRTSLAALMNVINKLGLTDNTLAFAPCVEQEKFESNEVFLVKSPHYMLQDGDFLKIPFKNGYVETNEGSIQTERVIKDSSVSWVEKYFSKIQRNEASASELPNEQTLKQQFWDEVFAEHFLDAEGKRYWTERNYDEDSIDEIEEGEGSGEGEDGGDEAPGSATTLAGHYFIIIALSVVLMDLH